MTESRPSKAQERFLKNEKRHHLLVGSARFLVFFLFAGLWELLRRSGGDSTRLFSAAHPGSLSVFIPWRWTKVFFSISESLYMNPDQLLSDCPDFRHPGSPSVGKPHCIPDRRTLPGHVKQPSKICSGAPAYRLARQPHAYDHSGCGFSGGIWLYFDLVYRIHPDRSGSDPPDPLPGRLQKGCSRKSSASVLHPPSHQHHEGEHRAMSGRSNHR